MSKAGASGINADIQASTTTLCTCWLITRVDSTVFAFTDHDEDVVVSAVTYKSALSYERTAIRTAGTMTQDSQEVKGILDSSSITSADLMAGKFNYATVNVFVVNWSNPSRGIIKMRKGRIGRVTRGRNSFIAELMGLDNNLTQRVGEVYQPTCRLDFGSTACGKDLTSLVQTGTVSVVTNRKKFRATGLTGAAGSSLTYTKTTISFVKTDGIRDSSHLMVAAGFAFGDPIQVEGTQNNDQFHTIKTITHNVVIDGITYDLIKTQSQNVVTEAAGQSVSLVRKTLGYFQLGKLTWTSGNNNGITMEVRDWDGTDALQLFLQLPYDIQVGDTFTITPGCDKRLQTCLFWDRVHSFDGEPDVPGQDQIYDYPNAQ